MSMFVDTPGRGSNLAPLAGERAERPARRIADAVLAMRPSLPTSPCCRTWQPVRLRASQSTVPVCPPSCYLPPWLARGLT